MQITPCFFCF